MRISTTLAVILSSALLFSACSSVKLDDKAPIEDRSGTSAKGGTDRTVSTVSTGSADALNDPKGILAKRSIYFDLDSYTIKDEFKPVVEAHARFLSANKNRKIVIQGNTDERGGREYNLALGQKRAEAVRKSLALLGVSDSQMEAVSFGKEKPKAPGSDEEAWAENRRADIVY
jgi:peptidoglycan-associated lipoprotein